MFESFRGLRKFSGLRMGTVPIPEGGLSPSRNPEQEKLCVLCVSAVQRLRTIHRGGAENASVKQGQELFFWFFRLLYEAGLGVCTAEAQRAQSKEFSIIKYSELCDLRVSVVNTSPQESVKQGQELFFLLRLVSTHFVLYKAN